MSEVHRLSADAITPDQLQAIQDISAALQDSIGEQVRLKTAIIQAL